MVRNAGHIQYASTRLSAEIDLRLGQLRFDPDDLCFVGAALNADRFIVSVDSDFREHAVAEYFKQELNLDIFAIEEALEELKKR
jgi:predicted nucleic acid-binding protein